MNISDKGLAAIERTAENNRNAEALLLVQLIREVRQLKTLLQEHSNTCNGDAYRIMDIESQRRKEESENERI